MAATQPIASQPGELPEETVESFIAAIHAGEISTLRSLVTAEHAGGIGGRTWSAWIEQYRNVSITGYRFRITDRKPSGDRAAVNAMLSNGEEMTFFLEAVGGTYRISGIDRRVMAARENRP